MFPFADKLWGRREKPEGTAELSGHAQSKEPPGERKLSAVGCETSRGLQGRVGDAASWKINQRPNMEIQGHAGLGLLSGAAMVLGDLGEKRRSRGEAKEETTNGVSR